MCGLLVLLTILASATAADNKASTLQHCSTAATVNQMVCFATVKNVDRVRGRPGPQGDVGIQRGHLPQLCLCCNQVLNITELLSKQKFTILNVYRSWVAFSPFFVAIYFVCFILSLNISKTPVATTGPVTLRASAPAWAARRPGPAPPPSASAAFSPSPVAKAAVPTTVTPSYLPTQQGIRT